MCLLANKPNGNVLLLTLSSSSSLFQVHPVPDAPSFSPLWRPLSRVACGSPHGKIQAGLGWAGGACFHGKGSWKLLPPVLLAGVAMEKLAGLEGSWCWTDPGIAGVPKPQGRWRGAACGKWGPTLPCKAAGCSTCWLCVRSQPRREGLLGSGRPAGALARGHSAREHPKGNLHMASLAADGYPAKLPYSIKVGDARGFTWDLWHQVHLAGQPAGCLPSPSEMLDSLLLWCLKIRDADRPAELWGAAPPK